MSPSDTRAVTGFRHEAAIYSSDAEFLDVVVPFLRGGVAAGEPTLLAVNARQQDLVCGALGDSSGVTVLAGGEQYCRPGTALRLNREQFTGHVEAGATQVRMVGEVPHPGTGAPWDGWARYEAAINDIYSALPVWSICPYDSRTTPGDVLADVEATHPHLATPDGEHQPNPRFEDPAGFLTRRPPGSGDPLETAPPVIELVDPTPVAARQAVHDLAPRTRALDGSEVDDLAYAVSEAVTNGICHGRAPVQLRLWTGPDRIVATVIDRGDGPTDPFAGLLPATDTSSAGLGLYLVHQMCNHVTFGRTEEGFALRLVAGVPRLPAERSDAF